jgi:hypothetical protein
MSETDDPALYQSLARQVAGFGFLRYFTDVDLSRALVDELVTFGAPRWAAHVAIKALAPMVEAAAKGGATWLGGEAARLLGQRLSALPAIGELLGHLDAALKRIDAKRAEEGEIAQVFAGRRPPKGPDQLKFASLGIKGQLAALQRLDRIEQVAGAILDRLTPAPSLGFRNIQLTEGSRFHYAAERVPFLGREEEMAALDDFLDAQGAFR